MDRLSQRLTANSDCQPNSSTVLRRNIPPRTRGATAHDGVVIALRWNIRRCSDHFELACRNGEIVRVLFAIDACDREVMGWLATSAGISGEMARDLMIACVEHRFGISKAAHPVEWLSDNGSAYIAKDTLDTATALGLKLCFTPVRSNYRYRQPKEDECHEGTNNHVEHRTPRLRFSSHCTSINALSSKKSVNAKCKTGDFGKANTCANMSCPPQACETLD